MNFSKLSSRKRKGDDVVECREFNSEWEDKYMFILGKGGKPVCLVCGFSVSVLKKYNLERNYNTNHAGLDTRYHIGSDLRKDFITRKKGSLETQKPLFVKRHEEKKDIVVASNEIALILARKKKPFSDAEEIVKPSLEIAAKLLGDKQVESKFKDISLSRNTIMRRMDELAKNVTEEVNFLASTCKFFSLAMDESNDIYDTSQLTIFFRAVNENFDVIEELLGFESMHGTTKGADLFDALKSCVESNNLDWAKLDSLCTDGAPAFTGKHSGCGSLLEQFLGRQLLKYHCIIHQEALCGRSLNLRHVMDVVMKCVNRIRARA